MHKIRALKDKYAAEAPSHEELSQLIANRFIQLENNAKEWEQRYQGIEYFRVLLFSVAIHFNSVYIVCYLGLKKKI